MRPPRNEPVQCVRCLNRFDPERDTHYRLTWRTEPTPEPDAADAVDAATGGVVLCPSCFDAFEAFVELEREMARGPGENERWVA